MAAWICTSFRSPSCVVRNSPLVFKRNTWIVTHALPFPATPKGKRQRPPSDLQIFQKYAVVECTHGLNAPKKPPLKLILTRYCEGYGSTGDVVEVKDLEAARSELLLSGAAIYASPENLKKLEEEKRLYGDTRTPMEKLSPFILMTAREIQKTLVVVNLNLDEPWKISPQHLRVSMRKMGLMNNSNDTIVLPKEGLTGPNLDLETTLFRFYVVLNGQVVVPGVARIHHVTMQESRLVITPGLVMEKTSEAELNQFNIPVDEEFYVSETTLDPHRVDIWAVMQQRLAQIRMEKLRKAAQAKHATAKPQKI